jgi:hypothetical protein
VIGLHVSYCSKLIGSASLETFCLWVGPEDTQNYIMKLVLCILHRTVVGRMRQEGHVARNVEEGSKTFA